MCSRNPAAWNRIQREKKINGCGGISALTDEHFLFLYPKDTWSKNYNVVLSVLSVMLDRLFQSHHPRELHLQVSVSFLFIISYSFYYCSD